MGEVRSSKAAFGLDALLERVIDTMEQVIRDLLDSAPDAMLIVDDAGRVAVANAPSEQVFGYTREELTGEPIERLVPERFKEAHARHRASYLADPRTRPMGVGLELYGRRKDGTEFPVEISLSPLRTGGRGFAIAAVRDVTDRRAEEERARQLVHEQAARAAAEDALRVRDEFLSIAAHELKTPLTSLRVFAELLEREVGGSESSERVRLAARRVSEQSRKLTTLVTQLVDVSRLHAGRLHLDLQEIDLAAVARASIDTIEAVSGRRVALREEGRVRVHADPIRLEQAVTNVIDNAVKYTPADRAVEIAVTRASDGYAILRVRDEGPGIPPEHREHIFDPFHRVDPRGTVAGMGLGLYISRSIVRQHGGEISALYPAGGGTTIELTLPPAATAI